MGTFIICPFLREMMEASLMISAMFFWMDSLIFSRWRAASLSPLWESSHSCFLMAINDLPNPDDREPPSQPFDSPACSSTSLGMVPGMVSLPNQRPGLAFDPSSGRGAQG